jgi:hypothetical protein
MTEKIKTPKRAMVCLIESDYQTKEEYNKLMKLLKRKRFKEVRYAAGDEFKKQNPDNSYIGMLATISSVDGDNKKSHEYFNCLSLIGFGDSKSGSVSFMAHVNSSLAEEYSMSSGKDFEEKLKKVLKDLFDKSNKGNIQICVLGGDKDNSIKRWSYDKAIKILAQIVESETGIKLSVLDPGYIVSNEKDVYIETKTRKIYHISETSDENFLK